MTVTEIVAEIERDLVFFDESGGGVTFTGGEPFAQPELLEALLHACRARRIQFNIVTAETLREAQREPDKHRDLIVRVAGYSDYFCDLTPALQGEIIARTEQAGF
jgi:pyruvate-formate lyase-activating enzyme